MKIERNKLTQNQAHSLDSQLAEACGPGLMGRICGAHCTKKCPSCGSTSCQCMCAHDCENLCDMLSSEGEDYPVEELIAPLVLELRRTGLFKPSWSCEGHLGHDGELWKVPRVWFTCESTLHLRILADMLKSLSFRKLISTPWEVKVSHSDDDNPQSTFALQPCPEETPRQLSDLQADARTIARLMPIQFKAAADHLKTNAAKALTP